MKKEVMLTICLLLLSCIAYSQTNFSFDYDANGNRITREIIVLKSQMTKSENVQDTILQDLSSQVIKKDDIKIYPNPTKGNLKIELNTNSDIEKIQINIINIKGQLVYKTSKLENSYTINLSSEPKGAYILIMQVNDKKYEWKIIKE